MHLLSRIMRCCGPAAAFAAAALAQTPQDPPPWWAKADNDTVSLYWSFDNAANPLQPNLQVVPVWFAYPPNTTFGFVNSANITTIPTLAGHVGALGFTGVGTGTISLGVDNDWRPTWVKQLFVQFDSFATASGTVSQALRQDLVRYKRANVTEKTLSLGAGWSRTTMTATLVPQPDWEGADFALTETALASVALDNLFVNTHCIAPAPDETGDALGEVDATATIDLLAATTNANCGAAVAVQSSTGVIDYWVAGFARAAGSPHELYRLSRTGTLQQTVSTPATSTLAPLGITDLTLAELPTGTYVYGIVDQRPGGPVQLLAIDAVTGQVMPPPLSFALQYPAGNATRHGLCFYPHGNTSAGSFLVTDPAGTLLEFDRTGAPLGAARNAPPGTQGAGYDPLTGNLYFISNAPLPLQPGVLSQVNGFEYSAYDFAPTGVRFLGDLTLPNPGGNPGGIASGLEVYRRQNGDFRAVCVVQLQQSSRLYELKGPFRFGWSLLGRSGMQGGPPFHGNANFQLTLDGVPHALFAALYFGFDNRNWRGVTLPLALTSPPLPSGINFPETIISIALDANFGLVPVVGGAAALTVPLPNLPAIAYAPTYWQWLILDPTVPGGFTLSQAGKTVIY